MQHRDTSLQSCTECNHGFVVRPTAVAHAGHDFVEEVSSLFDKYLGVKWKEETGARGICTAVLRSPNISISAAIFGYANVSVTRLPDCSHATESLGFW